MLKRSVEGMSCIAESGIYLFIICITLRHPYSPLVQCMWLYSSHDTREIWTGSNILVKMY